MTCAVYNDKVYKTFCMLDDDAIVSEDTKSTDRPPGIALEATSRSNTVF